MPNETHPQNPAEATDSAPRPDSAAGTARTQSPASGPAKNPAARRPGSGTRANTAARTTPRYTQSQYTAPKRSKSTRRTRLDLNDVPLPWLFILFCYAFFVPIGMVMTAINVYYLYKQRQGKDRIREAWHPSGTASAPSAQPQKPAQPQQSARPVSADTVSRDRRLTDVMMIVGIILTALGGIATLGSVIENLWILSPDFYDLAWFLEEVWPPAMLLFGGLGLLFGSHRMRTSWLMRRKISNIVGDADFMYIADIAAVLGCTPDKCVGHLEHCIVRGMFGPGAYLDMRSRALVVRGEPPRPEEKPEAPAPQPEPESAVPAERNRYDAILQELRRINDAIPGEEMSAKIDRLESVAAKIFVQLQEDPDKLPQLRKFMDYYLPTSMKLLNTYAELDAQGVEGANISESKRRIEQSMDTLVTAFENQLDKLFQADAMDVSADIEVMEKMLNADGLTGDDDPFGLHKVP